MNVEIGINIEGLKNVMLMLSNKCGDEKKRWRES